MGRSNAARVVARATLRTESRAKILCPVKTGLLRATHVKELTERRRRVIGRVIATRRYAAAVHNGHRAFTVYPKQLMSRHNPHRRAVLRFTVGGRVVYAQRARIPATKGRPWLATALKEVAAASGFRYRRVRVRR